MTTLRCVLSAAAALAPCEVFFTWSYDVGTTGGDASIRVDLIRGGATPVNLRAERTSLPSGEGYNGSGFFRAGAI